MNQSTLAEPSWKSWHDDEPIRLGISSCLLGAKVRFDVATVMGSFVGKLAADGESLAGEWSQSGMSFPLTLERATEADMLTIQLDDQALFLGRWRELLLNVLTDEALTVDPEYVHRGVQAGRIEVLDPVIGGKGLQPAHQQGGAPNLHATDQSIAPEAVKGIEA